MSDTITIPIDNLFYFWVAIWYLIILFYSWNIPVIWDKIKGVETLFIAGVLGYILTQLTRNLLLPVINIISKTIENLESLTKLPFVDLPAIPDSGPGNDIINIVSLELFILSFSVLLFMGTIFLILRILRYALDPEGTIFGQYKRFQIMDKFKLNEVIPLGIPRFLLFITMVILILFELILGSIQNIFKLAFAFSSIIDYVYYILGIGIGLIMLILFIPFIIHDGKQIYAIISAIAEKIKQFRENYINSQHSEKPNIYIKIYFDKYLNIVYLFLFIISFVFILRGYNYGKISIAQIIFIFLISILAIVSSFLIRKFRKKKLV